MEDEADSGSPESELELAGASLGAAQLQPWQRGVVGGVGVVMLLGAILGTLLGVDGLGEGVLLGVLLAVGVGLGYTGLTGQQITKVDLAGNRISWSTLTRLAASPTVARPVREKALEQLLEAVPQLPSAQQDVAKMAIGALHGGIQYEADVIAALERIQPRAYVGSTAPGAATAAPFDALLRGPNGRAVLVEAKYNSRNGMEAGDLRRVAELQRRLTETDPAYRDAISVLVVNKLTQKASEAAVTLEEESGGRLWVVEWAGPADDQMLRTVLSAALNQT
ncbi:hypothetical protein [Kribbella sp. NPDC051770]|uniref:hypothetical protein n=1 Tax=Kribbella sp. NPDC051770 TaxID=3155413 RepID=UPI0034129EBD